VYYNIFCGGDINSIDTDTSVLRDTDTKKSTQTDTDTTAIHSLIYVCVVGPQRRTTTTTTTTTTMARRKYLNDHGFSAIIIIIIWTIICSIFGTRFHSPSAHTKVSHRLNFSSLYANTFQTKLLFGIHGEPSELKNF